MKVWALALFMVILAQPAIAKFQQCLPHELMMKSLARQYSEAPRAIGTVTQKRIMEVYVSKAGSWTVILTTPDGTSCMIAAGQDWEDVPNGADALDPAA